MTDDHDEADDLLAQLEQLDELRTANQLRAEQQQATFNREAQSLASSWEPVDWSSVSDDGDDPPTLLQRADGKHLLYAGCMHWISGPPESLKSWLAQMAAAQCVERGGDVLYLDFEDRPHRVRARLQAMGAERADVHRRVVYLNPWVSVAMPEAAELFGRLVDARPWQLVVIDGVTESLGVEGLDLHSNVDVAQWVSRLPRRMSATGAAVVVIDHVTKSTEQRGRFAIGAQHKLAAIDGAAFGLDVLTPMARPQHEPVTGRARLVVVKDRPGWVRSVAKDRDHVGTVEVTAYPDGGVSARIVPDVMQRHVDMTAVAAVMDDLIRFGPNETERHLFDFVDLQPAVIAEALTWLLDNEWITVARRSSYLTYTVTDVGRNGHQ